MSKLNRITFTGLEIISSDEHRLNKLPAEFDAVLYFLAEAYTRIIKKYQLPEVRLIRFSFENAKIVQENEPQYLKIETRSKYDFILTINIKGWKGFQYYKSINDDHFLRKELDTLLRVLLRNVLVDLIDNEQVEYFLKYTSKLDSDRIESIEKSDLVFKNGFKSKLGYRLSLFKYEYFVLIYNRNNELLEWRLLYSGEERMMDETQYRKSIMVKDDKYEFPKIFQVGWKDNTFEYRIADETRLLEFGSEKTTLA